MSRCPNCGAYMASSKTPDKMCRICIEEYGSNVPDMLREEEKDEDHSAKL